jgi:hypothetical protein
VPGEDLMVIKPSGISYDELTPDAMVVTDLFGRLVDGELTPSSDTAAHAYVYRHMPHIGGVVHTHSTYATAWAARGEPIPCVLTMIGVDRDDGEVAGQRRQKHAPRVPGLRPAVDQQQRRAVAADDGVQPQPTDVDEAAGEGVGEACGQVGRAGDGPGARRGGYRGHDSTPL